MTLVSLCELAGVSGLTLTLDPLRKELRGHPISSGKSKIYLYPEGPMTLVLNFKNWLRNYLSNYVN